VIAGDLAHLGNAASLDLRQRLVNRLREVGRGGKFLHEIAEMDGEGRFEGRDLAERVFGAGRLQAPHLKFKLPRARVSHIVGVGDDDEFETGCGQE
jgi:hypothetical protein